MSTTSIGTNKVPGKEFLTRRGKQRLKFIAATALTLVFSTRIHRTIKSLKYIPKIFDSNSSRAPPLSRDDAAKTFVLSTGITTGLFSMCLFGGCWIFDISTPKEFRSKMEGVFHRGEEQTKLVGDDGTAPIEWDNVEISQMLSDIFKK